MSLESVVHLECHGGKNSLKGFSKKFQGIFKGVSRKMRDCSKGALRGF